MEVMSSESWRAAIAEQNARLGIKPSPPPATLPPKKPVGHVERTEERESIAAGLAPAPPRRRRNERHGEAIYGLRRRGEYAEMPTGSLVSN